MTERELAQALNVSRNSVREAINKLVTLRFLEQRQGQGTFVRSMDETVKIPLATVMETQDASLIDLLEMRMGIECNAASLAAQRANADGSGSHRKGHRGDGTDTGAGGLGTEGDLSFHMAIAMATKNPCRSIS
jgi:GntR family transcriptional repressor for pyruvate dehydrogenase complex